MTDYTELVKALRCGEYKPECGSSDCPYWSGLGCMDGQLMEDASDAIEALQAASPWHRVEDEPKEPGKQYVVWASKGYAYYDKWLGDRWLISSVAPETVTHWMPIEPPKEDA